MKVTVDIDKEYNDKNIALALGNLPQLDPWKGYRAIVRRSAHGRIHIDIDFMDDSGYVISEIMDYHDLEDMFMLVFRLAAGDDIRRVRGDAVKWMRGEEISHWIPAKEDYEKMREKGK
jgi:hypothetical protein